MRSHSILVTMLRLLGTLFFIGATWVLFALITSAQASAAPAVHHQTTPPQVWDSLARCESSGNWKINTGNGFYGGLQFTPSTWRAFGGRKYAALAHLATKEQQIAVGEQVARGQGWKAWPACAKKLGLIGKAVPAKAKPQPTPAPKKTAAPKKTTTAKTKTAPKTTAKTKTPAQTKVTTSANPVWEALAQCSSGGNWATNPGNGVSGGFAVKESTWRAYGGLEFAPQAYLATKHQQMVVAERIARVQGWKAWPTCAKKLGLIKILRKAPAPKAPAAKAVPPKPKPTAKASSLTKPAATAAAPTGSGVTVTLPSGATVTAPNAKAATAVKAALSQLGVRYSYGAARPGKALDCSALIQYAYRQAGVSLPRMARHQAVGAKVPSADKLMAGDLIVWKGHVAMYLGNGQMLETGATVAKVTPLRTKNMGMRLLGFFRPTEGGAA